MADKPKLSKDEVWLEKTFGTVIAKLDKNVQEGGKGHKKFLDDLEEFKAWYEAMEKTAPTIAKAPTDKADPKKAKLIETMLTNYKDAKAHAKKGEIAKALKEAMTYREGLNELTKRPASGGVDQKNLGQRMSGIVVR